MRLFALLLYMITVISLPLLLDREVDFVTAMITSFETVMSNPVPMLAWGVFIALITFLAMMPVFLGLFIVLPLLGHATWHLYHLIVRVRGGHSGYLTVLGFEVGVKSAFQIFAPVPNG